jgi:hypothetical protein
MLGKLSEAMSKLIQKQTDTTSKLNISNCLIYCEGLLIIFYFFFVVPTTTETEDAVPISAKHLERIERVSSFISHNSIQVYH